MQLHEQVCVVDDDQAVCDSLQELLIEDGYRVVTFTSGEIFLSQSANCDCACVVLDLRMPRIDGLALQEQLRQLAPQLPCIFLTGFADIPATVKAMKRGAIAFLEKPCNPTELLQAVREAVEYSRQQRQQSESVFAFQNLMQSLTEEERRVFDGITRGLSNPQIAIELDVSVRTVQFRKSSLMKKLGVETRADLMSLVVRGQLGR